eukprot:CAMPEP_0197021880 /NCGR_PEP_ID=MMETSP1384-20130603/2765_1 /TAXON_ID=29189 /ORGANISM="Ammonia sp." /LENGTH=1116 /DNA_ID=CAMNT_0042449799 /DNA_START=30 /DNA_END=3380 /DNA_ORIENTATION=-
MQEIAEEVDLDQFVSQPIPEDPDKLRLSLIFSKDLITTLQQDIADLHHRLHIADSEYDATQEVEDAEDDAKAGVHVMNATLTKMDGLENVDDGNEEMGDVNLYDDRSTGNNNHLYEMSKGDEDYDDDDQADIALNKKQTDHERFFSTYNILSKQINTQDTLVESMGTFEALITLTDNAITFNEVVANLKMRLKTAKDSFDSIRDALDNIRDDIKLDEEPDIMDKDGSLSDEEEENLEKNLFISNAKEVLRESAKVANTIDATIDELNGAKHLIHPDQKKIFALHSRVKELEVALPLHKIKKLAILNELPRFIKQELSDAKIQKQAEEARELQRLRESRRGHKKKRTKTLVEDEIVDHDMDDIKFHHDDEHDREKKEELDEAKKEEQRIDNFGSTMDAVASCIETLQTRLTNIHEALDTMNTDMESLDDDGVQLLKPGIESVREDMKTCEDRAHDIVTYFTKAKEYVHPTQNVLITAVNQFIEQRVQNDALQKQLDILKGELCAKDEQIAALKQEKLDAQKHAHAHKQFDDEAVDDAQQTHEFVLSITKQLRDLQEQSDGLFAMLKQPAGDDEMYTENKESAKNDTAKNKTSLTYDEIKQMDTGLTSLREQLDDLTETLVSDDYSVLKLTPPNEYMLRLESRYLHLKKLYRLKFKELEKAKDAVIYNETLLQQRNDEVEELETRLVRIMTSASTAAETRMEAINSMGQRSQTYRTVMDLIEENVRSTQSALREVVKIVKMNVGQNRVDPTDSKNLQNYTRTIKKGLDAVHAEMSGARNFVHPDREMVQALQEQILAQRDALPADVPQSGGNDNDNEQSNSNENSGNKDTFDQDDYSAPPVSSSKVHFKSKTSKHVGFSAGGGGTASASGRRTKSVHEIAWSKFNADHETNMEELQKKEQQVMEEEIRQQILDEIQEQYDDKFDAELSKIRSNLQQKIREEIRMEYEDLLAHASSNANNSNSSNDNDYKEPEPKAVSPPQQASPPQADVEQIKMQLEEQYDHRLEAEKKKIEEYYSKNENDLNSEVRSLGEENGKLQQQCNQLQQQCSSMQQDITDLQQNLAQTENRFGSQLQEFAESKRRLILSTSAEIDALRYKIKMYTEGNWNAVISAKNKNGYI